MKSSKTNIMKKLFSLAFALLLCNALFSQDSWNVTSSSADKSFRIAVGPKIGAGMVMATDPTVAMAIHPDGFAIDFKNGLTVQGGLVANVHFGRRVAASPGGTGWLGIQVEALYGYRSIGTEQAPLTMHCVEIPVLLQVYPITDLAINLGTTIVRTLKCSPEMLQFDDLVLNTSQLAGSSDVMLTFGASYKILEGFLVDFRYNLGMSTMAGNFNSKVSSLTASFAYLFNFVK